MSTAIGQPLERVDGRAKVTGAGRYSAEVALPRMAYAVLIGSRVPSGRVGAIDTSQAERAAGVLAVLTHRNLRRVAAQLRLFPSLFGHPAPGESFFPMQDDVVHYAELLRRHALEDAEALGSWKPTGMDTGYAMGTFGAQFAEVAVDPDLGLARVRRLLGVFAPGRVLNPRTARSQLMGGMLWGVGHALLEGTIMDPRAGRWANASLGEYLVPVNADAPDVEVELVEVRDEVVNPLGVKGVGEIGLVGTAAAIANAVFHAIGRRVRELPIRIEHLL